MRVGDPELGGDEDLVPRCNRPGAFNLSQGVSERGLRIVCRRHVKVAVPCVQGSEDCLFHAGVPLGLAERRCAVQNLMRGISLPKLCVATGIAMAVRSSAPVAASVYVKFSFPRGTHGRNDHLLLIKC
jgi:hypothetical protein